MNNPTIVLQNYWGYSIQNVGYFFIYSIILLKFELLNQKTLTIMKRLFLLLALIAGFTSFSSQTFAQSDTTEKATKKVLVIGAHPDDAETCCGGTMLLMRQAGYEVVSVYLTRGKAAEIRTQEAINACKLMDARPVFMTQKDGSTEVNAERYKEMYDIIEQENPDMVFTHWPVDLHRDHGVCANLVIETWKRLKYKFDLYFFEPETGQQAQLFSPTDYVDISDVADKKREVCDCHVSQNIANVYAKWHDAMERFRGAEFHCKRAEAFIHLRRSGNDIFEK